MTSKNSYKFKNATDAKILSDQKKYVYEIGYEVFGPVMYSFCEWINKNSNGKNLLFVSREGEVFKEFYDIMYPQNEGRIIYLSRSAVVQGMAYLIIKKCPTSEAAKSIYIRRHECICEVFKRIGVDVQRYLNELKECGLKPNDKYDMRINAFIEQNRTRLLSDTYESYKYFKKYTDDFLKKDFLLVDIGWQGSMQNLIEKYISLSNLQISAEGLYFGIMDDKNKKGFLFTENNKMCQDVLCFSGLLEILMMPDHGSVINYIYENNEINPVFSDFEFTFEKHQIIKCCQNGIRDYIKKINSDKKEKIDNKKIIKRFIEFGCEPSKLTIRYFGSLELFENGQSKSLINNVSFFHFRKWFYSFLDTKWKTGYLKNTFVIRFPYNKLVSIIRRISDKHPYM